MGVYHLLGLTCQSSLTILLCPPASNSVVRVVLLYASFSVLWYLVLVVNIRK